MRAAQTLHTDRRTDMTKQKKIALRCVCQSAYKDARNGLYNRPHPLVGEFDLHLGNITCCSQRRHKYKSTEKVKQINGVTVTTRLLPPFNPFMRALSTKTKSVVYGNANFILQHLH
jgi:hypothetical protein